MKTILTQTFEHKGTRYNVDLEITKDLIGVTSPWFTETVTNVRLSSIESLIDKVKTQNEQGIELSEPEDLVAGFLEAGFELKKEVSVEESKIYFAKEDEAEKGDWFPGALKRGRIITYDTPGIKKWILIDGCPKEVLVEWDNKHGYFNCAGKCASAFDHIRFPHRVFETKEQAWEHLIPTE